MVNNCDYDSDSNHEENDDDSDGNREGVMMTGIMEVKFR